MNRLVLLTLPPPHCLRSYFKFIRHLPPYSPPALDLSVLYFTCLLLLTPCFPNSNSLRFLLPLSPTPSQSYPNSLIPQIPTPSVLDSTRTLLLHFSNSLLFLPHSLTPPLSIPYHSHHRLQLTASFFSPPPSLRNADECLVVVKR